MATTLGRSLLGARQSEPLDSFPDDVDRGHQQQRRFDKRRKTLDFSVAVEMLRIGGLVRHSHRKVGDHRGDQIKDRMQRLGKNSQAAGDRREKNLQRHQHDRRAHRPKRRHAFFAAGMLDSARNHAGIIRCGS